jgi:hypothetical protein
MAILGADTIKSGLEALPTWKDRVLPIFELTSPTLRPYFVSWIGDETTLTKKIADYDYPDREDTAALDLGNSGMDRPMTLFFTGVSADTESRSFQDAFKDRGQWTILHPTEGFIDLMPYSVTRKNQPVKSGNVWVVEVDFKERITIAELTLGVSTSFLELLSGVLLGAAGALALVQAVGLFVLDSVEEITAITSSFTKAKDSIQDRLASQAELNEDVNKEFNQRIGELEELLIQPQIDVNQILTSTQELIALPAKASKNFTTRFELYRQLTNDLLGLTPSGSSPSDKNTVASQEFLLSSIIMTNTEIVTSTEFGNRAEALTAITNINTQFKLMTGTVEETQKNFKDELFKNQYFSQTDSYSSLAKLQSKTIEYLNVSLFDLAVEKRVVIGNPTSTLAFVVNEYGSTGENDELFTKFLSSNKLHGKDILLLPRDKEVVVNAS